MKALYIPLEDAEHEKLVKIKGERTWRKFIKDLIKNGNNNSIKGN